jgi:hypothetical protein
MSDEYSHYVDLTSDFMHRKMNATAPGLRRKLDEVESIHKDDPKRMAALHHGDGYYYENQNPYEKHTANYNAYENHFLTMQLEESK